MKGYESPQLILVELELEDVCAVSVKTSGDADSNTKSIFDIFN